MRQTLWSFMMPVKRTFKDKLGYIELRYTCIQVLLYFLINICRKSCLIYTGKYIQGNIFLCIAINICDWFNKYKLINSPWSLPFKDISRTFPSKHKRLSGGLSSEGCYHYFDDVVQEKVPLHFHLHLNALSVWYNLWMIFRYSRTEGGSTHLYTLFTADPLPCSKCYLLRQNTKGNGWENDGLFSPSLYRNPTAMYRHPTIHL